VSYHAAHLPPLPLELWALDESRFGLQTVKRRRLTLKGVKPIGTYQHRFENFWLYGVVAPRSGAGYFATQHKLDSATFQAFLNDFAASYATTFNLLLLDNARAHHAAALRLPPNIALLFLPPDTPELNPCERVWQAVKDQIAWHNFSVLPALQDQLASIFEAYDDDALRSLTAYPYLTEAIHALAARLTGITSLTSPKRFV